MKFRKKPVIVDAVQFTQEMKDLNSNLPEGVICIGCTVNTLDPTVVTDYKYGINTLEGVMSVVVNDWIITGVKGEHYPCRQDIFELTYEKVEEA